jgi:cell surface protein SprA
LNKRFANINSGILLFFVTICLSNHLLGQGFGGNTAADTSDILFPVKPESNNPYSETPESPLYLSPPSNIKEHVEFNPETNEYEVSRKIGDRYYRPPITMSVEEYSEYQHKKALREYWQQRAQGDNYDSRSAFIPKITVGGEAFDKIFGTNTINITPQGSAELVFGFNMSRIDNPSISEKLRKTPSFTFEERIQMNVTGTIGDKFELGINYNTDATFEFENKTKLEYSGKEDEIIKKIEAGNVTLPLSGSLITGSQSLFGLKTELQFGKLYVTTVFSQQKGETSVIEMEGGAQMNEFEVPAIDYDANKHFFVSQYFRDRYEEALKGLPIINSPVTITKMEVWVTNKTGNYNDARDIVAFTDLAEPRRGDIVDDDDQFIYNDGILNSTNYFNRFPGNNANVLYDIYKRQPNARNSAEVKNAVENMGIENFIFGQDFEKLDKARLLSSRDYKFHPNLGYISLNTALNADEILAVSYEFTVNGTTYKVGELSNDGIADPQVLIVKLLKGTSLSPKYPPTWNLMMKNAYAIGAFQITPEDFELEVLYYDDKTGTAMPYLKEGKIKNQLLLRVMNLDRLNSQGDPKPDGVFDYYEGVTVYSSNGRIFFPSNEPFGKFLRDKITGTGTDYDSELDQVADNYVFEELYEQTQTVARQQAEKNKFQLTGRYKSSSSNEIMLNAMNVPRGSVTVTAGGQQLREGADFTVDYTLGRVKIINQGILESGIPIRVSLESQSLFDFQTKTMIGTNLNYRFSDNFIIGGTLLRLNERPFTKKVNIGEEPISNTIWGLNGSYNTESQFLTTLVDRLPLIDAKEPSSIRIDGEFAQLIPGSSKTIGKNGVAYIDDFEGTETSIEMKTYHTWSLASLPQGQPNLFPESRLDSLGKGFNRARLAWYSIDQLFLSNGTTTPSYMRNNSNFQGSHYVRDIKIKEIFPEKDARREEPPRLNILNLAYYPNEVGPYNFVVDDTINISGLRDNGMLKNPSERWAGIMRPITTNDFEEANVEFIEFWLMDPFVEDSNNTGGYLYFNLGDVSEDVLPDSRMSFENGLPATDSMNQVMQTPWARIPNNYVINKAFDVDPNKRKYQDVGLDGVRNEAEKDFFSDYVNRLKASKPAVYDSILNQAGGDFAHDDFKYYRGEDYGTEESTILERYKFFSNPEGNSPVEENNNSDFPKVGTLKPDSEDINGDNTLNESENYYQYRIEITPESLNDNHPYITNKRQSNVENHLGQRVTWYQFKVPIKNYEQSFGAIDGFKSIRFMRMFLKDFGSTTIMRFAKLELVRSEWRKYELPFGEPHETLTGQSPETSFDILSVNVEENTEKQPVSYVLPPGIDRANDPTNPQIQQMNEQSIVLRVHDLTDGDARAAFKTINMDMRQYTKLKMDVHAEAIPGIPLDDYELTAFIRLGTDYKNNFYEYEIPLKITPPGQYYNNGKESDKVREIVWPRENFFNIELEEFLRAKQKRNDVERSTGDIDLTSYFQYPVQPNNEEYEGHMITVVGNPSLSDVRVIMIGIRNPSDQGLLNGRFNDGAPKSAEIWMNELRLTDFKDDGGWAANARIQTRLSDFGTFNVAGSILTPGFGSIEKKVNERAKEEVTQYDVSTNLQLGKLFPEKAKVNIPMFVGFSETIINPQYNPLDGDIPLKASLDLAVDDAARDSIKDISQDRTTRKSINFTNVKVNQQSQKPKPWDPANFSVSYAYNDIESSNINTEYDWEFNHRGSFNYVYSLRPKNVQPLGKAKFLNNPYLRIVKDFNFYYLPSRISYRTDISRHYSEIKKRNFNVNIINDPLAPKVEATADRNFLLNWYFDMKFDLTRALKVDYSASNMRRIDEGDYLLRDQENERDSMEIWRDELYRNVMDMGRSTNFNQRINAQYTVPINKLPVLDWTSLTARYGATYDWIAGPRNQNEVYTIGHTIKNSNTIQLNNNNNLVNLYNKMPYLKKINQVTSGRGQQKEKVLKQVTFEAGKVNLFANRARTIEHRLKTEKISVTAIDENGNNIEVETSIVDKNKIRITAQQDYQDVKVIVSGDVERGANPLIFILENGTRTLMSARNLSISYTQNNATTLPGYNKLHNITTIGREPGWAFIGGWQSIDDLQNTIMESNGWLTDSISQLNAPLMWSKTQSVNIRSNVEPFNGFRIDLNASWNESKSYEQFYNKFGNTFSFPDTSYFEGGSMSISVITLQTVFRKNADSLNYEDFKRYRTTIADRLADNFYQMHQEKGIQVPDSINQQISNGIGWGPTSQQVLIPAFLAAYTGQDPGKVKLNPLIQLKQMLPNWRITYDGLSRIEWIKEYFRSINLNHSYRSIYSISSYRLNPMYKENTEGVSYIKDLQGNNFVPKYEVSSISITEQFSPLISVDMNWKNSLTTRVEIKKSRNVNFSLSNNQISEMSSDEMAVGLGYRFDAVRLFINQRTYESDVNVRGDLSIRDNINRIRTLAANPEDENSEQNTAGQKVVSVKFNADYVLNDRFNMRFFFDRVVNKPKVTSSFPTANTNVGFSITFTLTQ